MMIIPLRDDGRAAGSPSVVKLPRVALSKPLGWSPDNRIGLSFNAPELTAIYTVPSSGGKAAQLTPKYATMPRWTPDQKKIFFYGANQGEFADLECIPAEGGKVTRVPLRGPHVTILGWGLSISPDGRTVLFQGRFIGTPEGWHRHMFTAPIEGGEVTEIAPGVDDFCCPAWAPDGKSFTFVGYHDLAEGKTVNDIYTIPANGGKAQKLTSDTDHVADASVAWSPDGSLIAFYSDDGSEDGKVVKLLPVRGSRARVLVEGLKGSHDEADLAWSPDGKQLAYINNDRIWKVSLEDGKSVEVKTGLDAVHQGIAWSPDGRTIAFSARQGGEQELWLMENFLPPAARRH